MKGMVWLGVVDLGPLEVTREKREHVPIPALGVAAALAGVVLVVAGRRGQ